MKSYHKDEKRVKTKERSKSARSYELMRQEEMERQCEEFFISLDCDSHEEVVRDESKNDVEEEKTQTLEVSLPSETRSELGGLSGLSCTRESVFEGSYNKGLDKTLDLKVGQLLTMLGGEKSRGSSHDDKSNGSYIIQCSEIPDLLFYSNLCFGVETIIIRGKIYDLLTRHFHYYMLLRLMVGLDNMVSIMGLFIWRYDLSCINLCKLSIVKTWLCFVLKKCCRHDSWGFNMLDVMVLRIGLFMVLLSRWKVINRDEVKQKTCFYFITNILICESNIWFNHVGRSLSCCHLNVLKGKHSLCYLGRILRENQLEKPVKLHLDSSSNPRELVALYVNAYPHLCLSVNDWMLHMLRHCVFELMKWFEPTWYCKMRSISLIGFKQRVYEHGVSTHLNATQISGFHYASVGINREFGCYIHDATVLRPRHFMIIFDPGGVCVNHLLELHLSMIMLKSSEYFKGDANNQNRISMLLIRSGGLNKAMVY